MVCGWRCKCNADKQPGSGIYTTTAFIENCTDHDITVPNWEIQQQGLRIFDEKRNELPIAGGTDRAKIVDKTEMYATIKAKKIREFTILQSTYRADKQALVIPDGSFDIVDSSGFFRHIPLADAGYSLVQAVLDTETEVQLLPDNCWRGSAKSPMTLVYWDLTNYRLQRLQSNAIDFEIAFNYQGIQDKPFYSLRICSLSRVRPDEQLPFHTTIALAPADAKMFFSALAKTGILRDGYDPIAGKNSSGYQMNIYAGKKDNSFALQLNMDTDLAMLTTFYSLQQALPVLEQEKMTSLLARFAGLRAQWEAELTLQQRITLMLTGRSIAQAAKDIVDAAGVDKIPLQIDEWLRDQPQPDLTLIDITVEDALQAMAESADISCVIRQGRVIIRPLLK